MTFIVLDGPDGTGKTSIAKRLATTLAQDYGLSTLFTAEPYLPRTREWLSNKRVTARELAFAFAHDRHVHMHEVVRPELDRNGVVICDRYVLSTIVYQSLHNPRSLVDELVADAHEPDLTIVLDAPTDVCMERLKDTGKVPDRFEEKAELQARVRRDYILEARARGYAIVDASRDRETVFADVLKLAGVAVLRRAARAPNAA